MPEVRQRFHEELRALEGEVQQTGAQARLLVDKALGALAGGDLGLCGEVIDGDDEVDALYLDVERRILHLFALQTGRLRPAAADRPAAHQPASGARRRPGSEPGQDHHGRRRPAPEPHRPPGS